MERRRDFQPFEFSVRPKWEEIVLDQQLITRDEFWGLWERAENGGKFEGSDLLRGAASFEVLGPRLVYTDNYSRFRSKIDFDSRIDLAPDEKSRYSSDFPAKYISLAVRRERGGYRLSVATHVSLKETVMPGDDRDLIPLAFLPDDPFAEFYGSVDEREYRRGKKRLADNGWETRREDDPHWSLVPFATELHHKYFVVAYREI